MYRRNGEQFLQEKYNTKKMAKSFYKNQMLDYLNSNMQNFISKQEMVFISTSDRGGNCDSSFRAGLPGFVRVFDNKTLIYPEYKGNGVMASLGNIIENPHIGLMFIDFLEDSIGLHVNGQASILENAEISGLNLPKQKKDDIEKEGNKPHRWVVIKVEEAYIHCSKHIPKFYQRKRDIDWGTDNEIQKGGDFFHVKQSKE
ncbi:pyridoxamine 5'-phosphate oxidase family protein [Alkalihalobacillus sp. AL-G]|uniref:pyridoxamine 5'-phosphate oxidase family protein n=1 Tax=Alkalihalobacillus sp. AL-G TaxID=2926399 RepID=UPI00272AC2B1|nr:pyridoxamine 5'-phosphate oxidase family protein [Alkalihalobacillus sp. AL-G]WLD94595.1 pyridoxamine 5'-phosphate oxidase family protein [Alkalihalobacillus sp. AL-G]